MIRALLQALQQAKQPGDHFSLTIAGRPGGVWLEPDEFRFGPLQLALQQLAQQAGQPAPAGPTLARALTLATDQIRRTDDPDAVLGSSLVLLITPNTLAGDLDELRDAVHNNAVGGIFLSVVGIGPTAGGSAVGQLVLLGQGNRRRLQHVDEAAGLIERELYAASRVVARAIRLRIRLRAGVKLVDVLGSYRLDEPQAQRVREAEQSIDRRLAQNLGIRTDRGEDEAGIQIVIPHFYAGDDHVILLDVVAGQAGPLAEVSVRYKDLVTLGNGVAHAQLSLDDDNRAAGPLQHNVLKNRLAFEFSQVTGRAGRQLQAGRQPQARRTLLTLRRLLQDVRHTVAAWTSDGELLHDERLLDDYIQQLDGDALRQDPQPWTDALRYIAVRKLVPGGEAL